jgi:hypothetical protein
MNKMQKREEKKQVKMQVCSLIWKKHLNGVALVVSGEALGRARSGGRPTLTCDDTVRIDRHQERSTHQSRYGWIDRNETSAALNWPAGPRVLPCFAQLAS